MTAVEKTPHVEITITMIDNVGTTDDILYENKLKCITY